VGSSHSVETYVHDLAICLLRCVLLCDTGDGGQQPSPEELLERLSRVMGGHFSPMRQWGSGRLDPFGSSSSEAWHRRVEEQSQGEWNIIIMPLEQLSLSTLSRAKGVQADSFWPTDPFGSSSSSSEAWHRRVMEPETG
jgi:hypothetical protein